MRKKESTAPTGNMHRTSEAILGRDIDFKKRRWSAISAGSYQIITCYFGQPQINIRYLLHIAAEANATDVSPHVLQRPATDRHQREQTHTKRIHLLVQYYHSPALPLLLLPLSLFLVTAPPILGRVSTIQHSD